MGARRAVHKEAQSHGRALVRFQQPHSENPRASSQGCHMTNMETKKGNKEAKGAGKARFPFPSLVPLQAREAGEARLSDISIFDLNGDRNGGCVRQKVTIWVCLTQHMQTEHPVGDLTKHYLHLTSIAELDPKFICNLT